MPNKYEYDSYIGRNVFGAGHWECVVLYKNGKVVDEWSYDGTLFEPIARRRALKRVKYLKNMYGATRI